jgi:ComF family protein
MRLLQSAVRWIYPAECSGCHDLMSEEFGFCGKCWSELGVIIGLACHFCGAPLKGQSDGGIEVCDHCLSYPRPWVRGASATRYGGLSRTLVLALKYADRTELARSFSGILASKLASLDVQDPLLVPIPLFWKRRWSRRYNQASLLVQGISAKTSIDMQLDALRRVRATPILKDLSDVERFTALSGAIEVMDQAIPRVRGRSIVLVDDVFTSGATFSSATNALLSVGAKEVFVLALARAGKNA